ncbi:unspecific monooxygenase [Leptolyngbya sp. Heron Island J]|uniref:cytochrome P450 n=1 Tax=Leptolyngbya sp. Heron Island J TaxID=1385935 RepID=UPI0003B943DA|nr:cytochrome P450 [Leptolyngbya sp. Heron Island J]ESA38716.1 unspecific monooxygenase [Leptolyngbya sp. Heron Island J]
MRILDRTEITPSNSESESALDNFVSFPNSVKEYFRQRKKSESIPGLNKPHIWSGNLRDIEKSGGINNFLPALHRSYGSVAKFWMGPWDLCVSLSDPDHISQISKLPYTPNSLQKPMKWMGNVFWVGRSSDNIESVRHARAKLTPLLESLLTYLCENEKYILHMLGRWQENRCPIDIKEDLSKSMFQTTGVSIIGEQFEQFSKELHQYLSYIVQGTQNRAEETFPPIWNLDYWRWKICVFRMHQIIRYFVRKERKNNDTYLKENFLCTLASQKDKDGKPLFKDSEIQGYLIDLLFDSGLQATPSALTWVCYSIAKNPDVQKAIQNEIDCTIARRSPKCKDLQKLTYLSQVIKESMRMNTPVSSTMRRAHTDIDVGGYLIPKGASICIPICALHQSQSLWENPKDFKPERFDSSAIKKQHRYAYLPFGFGERGCIGARYAVAEMQWVIAMILQKFSFRLEKEEDVISEMKNLSLQPRASLRLFIEPRSQ